MNGSVLRASSATGPGLLIESKRAANVRELIGRRKEGRKEGRVLWTLTFEGLARAAEMGQRVGQRSMIAELAPF